MQAAGLGYTALLGIHGFGWDTLLCLGYTALHDPYREGCCVPTNHPQSALKALPVAYFPTCLVMRAAGCRHAEGDSAEVTQQP